MAGCGCGKINAANTVTPEQLEAAQRQRDAEAAALAEREADSQLAAIANAGGGSLVPAQ